MSYGVSIHCAYEGYNEQFARIGRNCSSFWCGRRIEKRDRHTGFRNANVSYSLFVGQKLTQNTALRNAIILLLRNLYRITGVAKVNSDADFAVILVN